MKLRNLKTIIISFLLLYSLPSIYAQCFKLCNPILKSKAVGFNTRFGASIGGANYNSESTKYSKLDFVKNVAISHIGNSPIRINGSNILVSKSIASFESLTDISFISGYSVSSMVSSLCISNILSILSVGQADNETVQVYTSLDTPPSPEDFFITTWNTSTSGEIIIIPTNPLFDAQYNYTIDWGDGSTPQDIYDSSPPSHIYANPGVHTVSIYGSFPHFYMNNDLDMRSKLLSIEQWGTNVWLSMEGAFDGCENLIINPMIPDIPNFGTSCNANKMFAYCKNLTTGNFSSWNTTNINSMDYMFQQANKFNENIDTWNVVNVTSMQGTFQDAWDFNSSLINWDVDNVQNMQGMFQEARSFNKSLDNWDVDNVSDMSYMFTEAKAFQGIGISSWDVSSVTNMTSMFQGATLFNQVLAWNIENVKFMDSMFSISGFDQDLSSWQLKSLESAKYMFEGSQMSVDNADATMIAWENNANTRGNVNFELDGLPYCASEYARTLLGTNNSWTINNDPAKKDPTCEVSDVLNFDGIDDYVILGTAATPISPEFTFEMVFQTDIYKEQTFLSLKTSSNTVTELLSVYNNGKLYTDIGGTRFSGADILVGEPNHIALTSDGTTLNLFLNGVLVGSMPTTSILLTGQLCIGTPLTAVPKISIDELRIWDEARTCHQIKDGMNCELSGSEANLRAYYKFDSNFKSGLLANNILLSDYTNDINKLGDLQNFTSLSWQKPGFLSGTCTFSTKGAKAVISGNGLALIPNTNTPKEEDNTHFGQYDIIQELVSNEPEIVKEFVIKNNGDKALEIVDIVLDYALPDAIPFTLKPFTSGIILPGQELKFKVGFQTEIIGDYFASVRVIMNDCNESELVFNIAAAAALKLIRPTELRVVPSSLTAFKLTWTDNSNAELNYEIERKLEGEEEFTSLIIIPANSTEYLDTVVRKGQTHFYRVRAYSGSLLNSKYTNIVGAVIGHPTALENDLTIDKFIIYPNPSEAVFNLSFENEYYGLLTINIYDTIGNQVYKTVVNKQSSTFRQIINLSNLAVGKYSLIMQVGESTVIKQIIKE